MFVKRACRGCDYLKLCLHPAGASFYWYGHSSTLQHTPAYYNTCPHTTAHYSTLQHTTAHYSTLQHTTEHYRRLQHTTAHYHTLQHTTAHSDTLKFHIYFLITVSVTDARSQIVSSLIVSSLMLLCLMKYHRFRKFSFSLSIVFICSHPGPNILLLN